MNGKNEVLPAGVPAASTAHEAAVQAPHATSPYLSTLKNIEALLITAPWKECINELVAIRTAVQTTNARLEQLMGMATEAAAETDDVPPVPAQEMPPVAATASQAALKVITAGPAVPAKPEPAAGTPVTVGHNVKRW